MILKHLIINIIVKPQRLFLLLIAVLIQVNVFAQLETFQWYFGNKAGLDFTSNPPSIITNNAMNAAEGCSAIADENGNLLFYTKGDTIWNRQHQIMANGTGILGHWSATQSCLIVRQPLSNHLYYVFTLDDFSNNFANGLRYSIVDMNLAATMGSVTVKNVLLFSPSTERLCATRHCNGTDIWILTHDWNSNNFRANLLTSTGVSTVAVISSVGSVHTGIINFAIGAMKISPIGNKLAVAIMYTASTTPNAPQYGRFELFDFNNSTGLVSNPLYLGDNFPTAYGCEFSPDGQLFYGSRTAGGGFIHQWNLCAGSPSAVIASQYTINTGVLNLPRAMQLGPDGKIYVAKFNQSNLSVINNPNALGAACNFSVQGISIAPNESKLGLPNFVSSSLKAPFSYTQDLGCTTVSFSPPPFANPTITNCFSGNSLTGITWHFGDVGSGPANTSTLINPVHVYPAMGTYTVKLVMNYSACAPDSIVQWIHLVSPTITVNSLSVSCNSFVSSTVNVQPSYGSLSYTWMPSAQNSSVALNLSAGVYTIHIKNTGGTCVKTVTTNIAAPSQISVAASVAPTCTNALASLTLSGGSGNYTYLWSPGSYTSSSVNLLTSGIYSVVVFDSLHQCSILHTLTVNMLPAPSLSVTGNFSICLGESAYLSADGANTYSWSTGANTTSIQLTPLVTSTLTVNGSGTLNSCPGTKSVVVKVSNCTGIEALAKTYPSLHIYPNPNGGVFTVVLQNESHITIHDAIGRLIYENQLDKGKHEIELGNISNGIYFVAAKSLLDVEIIKVFKE